MDAEAAAEFEQHVRGMYKRVPVSLHCCTQLGRR
jgi:hypothetical protein